MKLMPHRGLQTKVQAAREPQLEAHVEELHKLNTALHQLSSHKTLAERDTV